MRKHKLFLLPALLLLVTACGNKNDAPAVIDDDGQQTTPIDQRTLTGIEIATQPEKLVYEVGDPFVSTGLVVKAVYSDQTKEVITEYDISQPDMSTAGPKTVTVTYNGKSASFTITVNAKDDEKPIVTSVSITFVEVYNGNYYKFSYDNDPWNVRDHEFKSLRINTTHNNVWHENLPALKQFNVQMYDITLSDYTFEWIDTNDNVYLSTTYHQDVADPEEGHMNEDGTVNFGLVVKEIYGGGEYIKAAYDVYPFREKYNFSYYTVNDGDTHETFSVKDRIGDLDVVQLHVGSGISGTVTIKFYNASNEVYGRSTFEFAVQ